MASVAETEADSVVEEAAVEASAVVEVSKNERTKMS